MGSFLKGLFLFMSPKLIWERSSDNGIRGFFIASEQNKTLARAQVECPRHAETTNHADRESSINYKQKIIQISPQKNSYSISVALTVTPSQLKEVYSFRGPGLHAWDTEVCNGYLVSMCLVLWCVREFWEDVPCLTLLFPLFFVMILQTVGILLGTYQTNL